MKLLYADTSALFKRYVQERESDAVLARIEDAPAVGTALITHVEVAAALAQVVRQARMGRSEAREAEGEFLHDWDDFTRIGVTEPMAERVGGFAWQYNLRGYDAVQLAAAVAWQGMTEGTEDEVVFACFDMSGPGSQGRRPRDVAGIGAPDGAESGKTFESCRPARPRR